MSLEIRLTSAATLFKLALSRIEPDLEPPRLERRPGVPRNCTLPSRRPAFGLRLPWRTRYPTAYLPPQGFPRLGGKSSLALDLLSVRFPPDYFLSHGLRPTHPFRPRTPL